MISYNDGYNSKNKKLLLHYKDLESYIEVNSRKLYPTSNSKNTAVKKSTSVFNSGSEGVVIFCDINTRIVHVRKLEKCMVITFFLLQKPPLNTPRC